MTSNQLNVLLTLGRDGRGTLVPKLADFGLAKAFGVIATPVTQPEQIFGTIKYMAPAPGTTRAFIPGIWQFGGSNLTPQGVHRRLDGRSGTPVASMVADGGRWEDFRLKWSPAISS